MLTNYCDCEFGYAEEEILGPKNNRYFEWVYYCDHPDSVDGICRLDNKLGKAKKQCRLLDKTSCCLTEDSDEVFEPGHITDIASYNINIY